EYRHVDLTVGEVCFIYSCDFIFFFFFFFSSRRRHTRLKRDWSSDVCSSDLLAISKLSPTRRGDDSSGNAPINSARVASPDRQIRSEERRVGKECRSRWSPDH